MQTVAIPVFRNQYLSTGTDEAARITSAPVPVQGNTAQLAVTVTNVTSSATVTIKLQGSYDGLAWSDVGSGSLTQNSFGYNDLPSAVAVDYAFLRVDASISGTNQAVLFDATIVMSSQ